VAGEAEGAMLGGPCDGELQLPWPAAAVVCAEVFHADDLRLAVSDHQLAVAHQQTSGVVAGDLDNEDHLALRRVDAVTEREDELVGRGLRIAVETDAVLIADSFFVDVKLREVLTFVQLQTAYIIRQWLQLRLLDFHSTAIRQPFNCNSTALRPFDDLRYDRANALRPK